MLVNIYDKVAKANLNELFSQIMRVANFLVYYISYQSLEKFVYR